MKIAVASDHRGFSVKGKVLARLAELGHEGLDFGPESSQSVDYPDYAAKVAAAVSSGQVDRGILICGTGMGMCIVANKFPGIRAAPCHDDLTAEMSRLHNDANVLCLSADLLGDRLVNRMVEIWLKTISRADGTRGDSIRSPCTRPKPAAVPPRRSRPRPPLLPPAGAPRLQIEFAACIGAPLIRRRRAGQFASLFSSAARCIVCFERQTANGTGLASRLSARKERLWTSIR